MRRDICLHGALGERFGPRYRLNAKTPPEAIRALCIQLPGFRAAIESGDWHVIRSGRAQDEIGLLSFGGQRELHIVPAVQGEGPVGRAIAGVFIAAAAFAFAGPAGLSAVAFAGVTFGNIAMFGASLILGGVAELLSPQPKLKGGKGGDNRENFLFSGLANVDTQGGPVPLTYGRRRVGGVRISAGISTDRREKPTSAANRFFSTWVEPPLSGSGGGKSGGAKASPFDQPDTLQSRARVKMLFAVSEGPCGGLADGLKSVYADGTPVQNEDGSYNFNNVVVEQRLGYPDQEPIKGFAETEAASAVGVEVTQAQSVTRTVSDTNADRVRVSIRFGALYDQDAKKGIASVTLRILLQPDGGSFAEVLRDTVKGRVTSPYDRDYEIDLAGEGPWLLRVERVTADGDRPTLQDTFAWSSFTTIIDHRFSYANTAIVAVEGDAEAFGGRVPEITFDWSGRLIEIPSNLDPETREYSGVWDGEFETAVYDNPAWVFWDLSQHRRYGLGEHLAGQVDKWRLHAIGQYCDGSVPDGFGGTEPRYTFNAVLNQAEDAWRVLQLVASSAMSMIYWSAGAVTLAADMPADPVQVVGPANTIGGQFGYAGTSRRTRHSVCHVTWFDPANPEEPQIEVVEEPALIERLGRKVKEIVAFGCTSRGMARRYGKWELESENVQTETVGFGSGLDLGRLRPGDIVPIHDPAIAGLRRSGRIVQLHKTGGEVTGIVTDAPVTLTAGSDFSLSVILPDGTVETRVLDNDPEETTLLRFTEPLSAAPRIGAMWGLAGGQVHPRQFRLLGVREQEELQFGFRALIHDPNKYARVEEGLHLEDLPFTALPVGPLGAPQGPVTAREDLVLAGDLTPRQRTIVSWIAALDARVVNYEVQFDNGVDGWQPGGLSNLPSIEIYDVGAGAFVFRVRSIDAAGRVSAWSESAEIPLDGLLAPPDDVTGFRLSVLGDIATLSWNPVANLNLSHYAIRFAPTLAGAQWGASSLIAPRVDATSFQTPALVGTYLIKAVTLQEVESVNAADLPSNVAGATNVVQEIEDHLGSPAWDGDHDGTVAGPLGELRLDFDGDVVGDWETLREVQHIGFGTGAGITEGVWTSAAFDLSEVYASRMIWDVTVGGESLFDTMANWPSLAEVEQMSGVSPSDWSVLLEFRTTEDDPSDPEAEWTEWQEFVTGDHLARGVQRRIRLRTFAYAVTPFVLESRFEIDMPDRVVAQDDIVVPVEGASVTFPGGAFKQLQGRGIEVRDLAPGDRPAITNIDRTGFDIEILDDGGSPVARTISYVAKGYGRQI